MELTNANIKKLLLKTDVIKYYYENLNGKNLWSMDFLSDRDERLYEYDCVIGNHRVQYNYDKGIYLYKHSNKTHKITLFAKITSKGIKFYGKPLL